MAGRARRWTRSAAGPAAAAAVTGYALVLRRRLAALPVLQPTDEPAAVEHRLVTAAGVSVDDATLPGRQPARPAARARGAGPRARRPAGRAAAGARLAGRARRLPRRPAGHGLRGRPRPARDRGRPGPVADDRTPGWRRTRCTACRRRSSGSPRGRWPTPSRRGWRPAARRRRPAEGVGRVGLRHGLAVHPRPAGRVGRRAGVARRTPPAMGAGRGGRLLGPAAARHPRHAVPPARPRHPPRDAARHGRRRVRGRPAPAPGEAVGSAAVAERRARYHERLAVGIDGLFESRRADLPGVRRGRPVGAGPHRRHAAEQAGAVHARGVRGVRARVPEPAPDRGGARLLLRRLLRRGRRGGDGAARSHRLVPVHGAGGLRGRPRRAAPMARRGWRARALQPGRPGRVAEGSVRRGRPGREHRPGGPARLDRPGPPRPVPRARAADGGRVRRRQHAPLPRAHAGSGRRAGRGRGGARAGGPAVDRDARPGLVPGPGHGPVVGAVPAAAAPQHGADAQPRGDARRAGLHGDRPPPRGGAPGVRLRLRRLHGRQPPRAAGRRALAPGAHPVVAGPAQRRLRPRHAGHRRRAGGRPR